MSDLCAYCHHTEEEHNIKINGFGCICAARIYDYGTDIQCYCTNYRKETQEDIDAQNKRSHERLMRRWEEDSISYKIKKFFGFK